MQTESELRDFYGGRAVLVTGGLGFIGSNLVLRLVELGASVAVLDAGLAETGHNPFNLAAVRGRVEIVDGDVGDRDRLTRLLPGRALVFNLAGTLSHTDSMRDPVRDLHANCTGHIVLLDAIRELAPDARILYAATRAQYGRARYNPVDEAHPQISSDANGINKAAGEAYHFLYGEHYGLFVTSLRLTNTYGPRHQMRHHRQGVLNWFVRRVLDGDPILVYGDGKQLRDVNHVDDVVAAMLAALASDQTRGQTYNLGGQSVRLGELAELLVRLNGGQGKVEIVPYPPDAKNVEVGDYVADITKIRAALGFEPAVSLEEGFAQTLEFYRAHRAHYW